VANLNNLKGGWYSAVQLFEYSTEGTLRRVPYRSFEDAIVASCFDVEIFALVRFILSPSFAKCEVQ